MSVKRNNLLAFRLRRQKPPTRSVVLRGALAFAVSLLLSANAQAQDNTSPPTLSIANVTVAENAGSVSLTVILSAESSSAVTVAYSGVDGTAKKADGDYSLTDGTLTIPAESTTGSIPVTIYDDDVDEANETFKIQLSSPSNAKFAGDSTTIDSTVTITDDDTRGVTVSPTSLEIEEHDDGYYSVRLNSEPTGTVTVTPSAHGDTDVTVSGVLTFTTENWNTAQRVTVSAAIDKDDDDDAATIRHAVSGGDYASVAASNVSVLVEDIIATSTSVRLWVRPNSVGEADAATTITVFGTLDGLPLESDKSVSISVGASSDTAIEGTHYLAVDDLTLTIDEGERGGNASFELTPIDNDVDSIAPRISVSGSTQGLTVESTIVYITDDDTRGVRVSRDSLWVEEGSSDVYAIRLQSQPTADVTVTPSIKWTDDYVPVSLPDALTFTAENWDDWQRVTVGGVEDANAVSGKLTISHSVSGGDYDHVKASDVRVTVVENDTRGFTLSSTSLEVNEGGTVTYTVVASAQPTDDVTVTPSFRSIYGTTATVSGSLTFTPANWKEAQTVTVTVNQDADGEDGLIVIRHNTRHSEGNKNWAAGLFDVRVEAIDDETESTELIVTADPDSLDEDAGATTVTVTVKLNAAPFSTRQQVNIGVGWPGGQHMVRPDPSIASPRALYVMLNPGETSGTFTFTVTPIDDDYHEDAARVRVSASLTLDESPLYDYRSLKTGYAYVRINDDDPPRGVTLSQTSVDVDENGSATYTVVLDSKPLTDVTVRPSLTVSKSDVTISGVLTFTGENWDEAQTVTVSAADDADAVDDTVLITHKVDGGEYRWINADSVSVTVNDDDTAGVRITKTALDFGEGQNAYYSIGLTTEPSESVSITLTLSGDADLTFRQSPDISMRERRLVFFPSLYGTTVVWVSAMHDTDAEDDTGTISHTVSGAEEYAGMTVADVTIMVDDDEIPADDDEVPADLALSLDTIAGDNTVNIAEKAAGFTISGNTGSEGGASVTVTVGSTDLTATSGSSDPATWSVNVPANASYITGTSVAVKVNASKTGLNAASEVTRSLTVDLIAPTAPTYTVPGSLNLDEQITAMSPSGGSGIDRYSATGLPSGLSIDASTGVISGTPDAANANTASVTVAVSDNAGNSNTVNLTFPAVPRKDQPFSSFMYSATQVTLGSPAPRLLTPVGPSTAVTYSASPSTVCTVDSSTGALTIVGAGDCVITATAEATAKYNQATATYTVTVSEPSSRDTLTAPTYTPPRSLRVGVRITSMSPSGGSGINGYSVTGLPSGLSINSGTGVISGTPSTANSSRVNATVTVSDSANDNTATVTITFPAVAKGDQTLSGFSYSSSSATIGSSTPTVTSPSAARGTVSYSASPSSVCTVNSSSGALTLIGAGTCRITATAASTTNYNQATATFTVTVRAATTTLTAPTYSAPRSLRVGVRITSMSPSGGSGINAYSATGLPSGLSINSGTGVISGTPSTANSSRVNATVTVSDSANDNTATVTITFPAVAKGDQTLSGFSYSSSSATIGSSTPTVTSPSAARGTVSYSASPSSVCTVNSSSGALTLIGAGTCRITATAASTTNYNQATATFTVTVQPVPTKAPAEGNPERAVTVSPSELTLEEGASATYTVVLDEEPSETVTVTPRVSGSPDLTLDPSSLTFTTEDWSTARTITVSAGEDDDAYHDSAIIYHAGEGGELAVTVSDNEAASQEGLPAQVSGLGATATATHVEMTWTAVEETPLGYRIEASYDRGANWAEVEDNTGSTNASYRHDVGLKFSETRRYRVSAVGENGTGLPSAFRQVSATSMVDGLTASARSPEDESDQVVDDSADSMSGDTSDAMTDDATDTVPSIDLCWVPEGVSASDLTAIAVATSPVSVSGSADSGELTWQSIGSGSSEVDCGDGIGFRTTSISSNQRYVFRMRATHAGAWLVSNVAEAVLTDSSEPLRTVVTAAKSGLSGDSWVPDPVCRDYDDPATSEDEEGAFFVSIGFTTASKEYLRYEPVDGFNVESDLALANATAELVDQPHDILMGYRVRITPRVWGSPVSISVPADVVAHAETDVGNEASGSFRRDTSEEVGCDTSAPPPASRAQVTAAQIRNDGNRDGEWITGEVIRVTLQYDERVTVDTADGVPGVTLTLGETATTDQTSDSDETGTDMTDQSTEGGTESDETAGTEVTALFSHVTHDDTLVFEYLVTADDSPVRDIALVSDSLALNDARINALSGPAVDLAHPGATVVDGQIDQPDLTADWSMIPAAHGGGDSEFEVHLLFSEAVDLVEVIGEANLIEHAFTVTNGSIDGIRQTRDRQGEYRAEEWAISVTADSEGTVTVAPAVELACDQTGAVCTVDDRVLAEAPSVIVHRTEQTLSVADAEVTEGPDAVLVFEVTLARPADRTVTMGYETADGTATAGEDYEETSGTLSIEAGQDTGSIRVPVLDDDHDEGEETLTLAFAEPTHARLLNDRAVGTIVNGDPIPSAWLARFGRAASDHVAQAVARRLERGRSEDHLKVGGVRPDRLLTRFAQANAPNTVSGSGLPGSGFPGPVVSHGTDSLGGATTSLNGVAAVRQAHNPRGAGTLPSLRSLFMGSSFFYTLGEEDDESSGPITAWGETASTRFSGSEGALALDGDVTTAILGLDKQYGRWLVGTTVSWSEGEGGYRRSSASGGAIESTLMSVNPYAHYRLNGTTSLWGVVGYGAGSLKLSPQGTESALETDLSNRMAAFGGRGVLSARAGDSGQFELALRSDALLTHTDSEAIEGLAAAQGATRRVRLLLEGSGSVSVRGGTLRPTLEAGLRYDGGDAETGAGLEVGGGLAYGTGRLSVEINARTLVAHQDTDYEEWGYSGSLTYRPGKGGRGLSLKLGSAWGAARSGVQSMWSHTDASGLAPGAAMDPGQRLQAEFGYGLNGPRGRALWVPFVGAEAGQGGSQSLRMGLKLTAGSNIEAGLAIGQQGSARGEARHSVQIRGAMRW